MTREIVIPSGEVCLVLMPYAALERPSIALSILKSKLAEGGIKSTVVYGNLLFADEIGVYTHDIVGKTQSHSLAGEWTFSEAAFPGFEANHEEYFAHVQLGLEGMLPLVRAHGGRGQMRGILRHVRGCAADFVDRLARSIVDSRPGIVGCSSTFQQHCSSLALLRRIKELDPSIATVMGGANCESSMGLVTHRECPWVDYVVSGEGEEPFLVLCRRILGKTSKANGAAFFPIMGDSVDWPEGVLAPEHRATSYETIGSTVPRARLENMDLSPAPEYDDYFRVLRESPTGFFVKPGLLIETSRGCWWGAVSHCTFCGLNGTSMGFRSKDPEKVIGEITTLSQKWGTLNFEVVDNILDLGYMKNVIPALADRNAGYDFFYETKANFTRPQLQLLARAGVRWLQPGIESLDDGILKAIAKGTTARQNLQLLKWAHDYGIYVLWIFLYDIPKESDEAYARMADWLPLISHLQAPSGFSFIQYNRFSPYHTRPQDFGLTISPDRSYSYVYPWPADSIRDFAYFFDDYTADRKMVRGVQDIPGRPGLTRLYRTVSEWQLQWQGEMNASAVPKESARLLMRPDGNRILIEDTRPCRVQDRFVLEGLNAAVYESCDQAHNERGVLREIEALTGRAYTWNEIAPILTELCDQKLMLRLEDGYYFSLALTGGLRPMPISMYPGGRLRTVAETAAAELLRDAEALVNGAPNTIGDLGFPGVKRDS